MLWGTNICLKTDINLHQFLGKLHCMSIHRVSIDENSFLMDEFVCEMKIR